MIVSLTREDWGLWDFLAVRDVSGFGSEITASCAALRVLEDASPDAHRTLLSYRLGLRA